MKPRVAIIGAGSFGQALAFVLKQRTGTAVEVWDTEARAATPRDLKGTVHDAKAVFVCVPSGAAREVLESIRAHLSPEAIVVATGKGIDSGRLTPDQLLEVTLLLGQPWALMSGPMLAAEIKQGQLSFAALAANDRTIFSEVQALFSGTTVRLEYSDDSRGVALAGVLKNVYAIGLGIVQALGLGHNVRGSLVMQACREMSEIIVRLGGRRETAWGLAGLADLVATGFSEQSRNGQVGKELVELGECRTASEGIESLPHVKALLSPSMDSYPVLAAIDAVAAGGMPAHDALAKLLAVRYERQRACHRE